MYSSAEKGNKHAKLIHQALLNDDTNNQKDTSSYLFSTKDTGMRKGGIPVEELQELLKNIYEDKNTPQKKKKLIEAFYKALPKTSACKNSKPAVYPITISHCVQPILAEYDTIKDEMCREKFKRCGPWKAEG